jgi:hypothetical protein
MRRPTMTFSFEAAQVVDTAGDGRFGQDPRGLLVVGEGDGDDDTVVVDDERRGAAPHAPAGGDEVRLNVSHSSRIGTGAACGQGPSCNVSRIRP